MTVRERVTCTHRGAVTCCSGPPWHSGSARVRMVFVPRQQLRLDLVAPTDSLRARPRTQSSPRSALETGWMLKRG